MTVGEGDMVEQPTFGEFMLGVEGLAILRSWMMDPSTVKARSKEVVEIVAQRGKEPWVNPIIGVERTVTAGYSEWADTYDDESNPVIVAEEAVVRSLIAGFPAGKALDAACGTGCHAAHMASLGHRVIGIDASARMLEVARSKVLSGQFETADLTSMPLEDGAMDLAVCSLALTHCADLRRPLLELGRVLRPGGTAIISDVHPFVVMLGGHAKHPISRTETGFVRNYVHPPSECITAFRESGLNIVQCVEMLCGDKEIGAMGLAEDLPGLMEAAFKDVPIVIVWELVKSS